MRTVTVDRRSLALTRHHDTYGALDNHCPHQGGPLGDGQLDRHLEAVKQAAEPSGRGELESSLAQHLKHVNDALDPHEQLDCLVVMTEAWTVDNDLITPTFKVKRNRVEDLFAKNYDTWVGMRKKVIWHQA